MLIAKTLMSLGIQDREIHLFDTFEGMSESTDVDVSFSSGRKAKDEFDEMKKKNEYRNGIKNWAEACIEDVKSNLYTTGYPVENITFIKGMVEVSLPTYTLDNSIALLRLDTDWYESTKCEFDYLYPLLSYDGVCIVDDYGSWAGSTKATDEYLLNRKTLRQRIGCSNFIVKKD